MSKPAAEHFWVNGVVAVRDSLPYVQLSTEHGLVIQLSIAQSRQVAADILQMAARTEMDAMVAEFMRSELKGPPESVFAMMQLFRDYRAKLDQEKLDRP